MSEHTTELTQDASPAGRWVIEFVQRPGETPEDMRDKYARAAALVAGIGGVSISFEQTETEHDPAPAFDAELEAQLSQPVSEILQRYPGKGTLNARIVNALDREKVTTVREVLVLGYEWFDDMRNTSERSIEVMYDALTKEFNDPAVWTKDTSPTVAARWCADTSQIPVEAFARCRGRTYHSFQPKSVADLQAATEAELMRLFKLNYEQEVPELRLDIDEYVQAFEAARNKPQTA